MVTLSVRLIFIVAALGACKGGKGGSAGDGAPWSCDATKDESTCTEWKKLSDADVALKRDNVCHLAGGKGEFAQKACPRDKLVGICASGPGADDDVLYYYATGAKPWTAATARAQVCDKISGTWSTP